MLSGFETQLLDSYKSLHASWGSVNHIDLQVSIRLTYTCYVWRRMCLYDPKLVAWEYLCGIGDALFFVDLLVFIPLVLRISHLCLSFWCANACILMFEHQHSTITLVLVTVHVSYTSASASNTKYLEFFFGKCLFGFTGTTVSYTVKFKKQVMTLGLKWLCVVDLLAVVVRVVKRSTYCWVCEHGKLPTEVP